MSLFELNLRSRPSADNSSADRRTQVPLAPITPWWTIPFVYAMAGLLLGLIFPRLAIRWLPHPPTPIGGGAALAIDCWLACGVTLLAVILFALALFAARFGALVYSPRLLPWIVRDRVLVHSVGVFAGTLLYAIPALEWVDVPASAAALRVNALLAVCLFLVNAAMFVRLASRLSRSDSQGVLNSVADHGRRLIDRLYPFMEPDTPPPAAARLDRLPVTQTLVQMGRPRTIQEIDTPALLALACASESVIEVVSAVGDTVGDGVALLHVRGASRIVAEPRLRDAFTLGEGRTFECDPRNAIRLLTGIAVQALSPAVNDSSTAVQALDQIQDLLLRLGRRRLDIGHVRDHRGELRVLMPVPTWEDYLDLALEEIRHYGASSIQVMRRMQALVTDLTELLPPERRRALRRARERLETSANRTFDDDETIVLASVGDRQGLGAPRRQPAADAVSTWSSDPS